MDASRRELLKGLALTGAGSLSGFSIVPAGLWQEGQRPAELAVIRGPDYRALTKAAVTELGGMARFVSRGDVVFVKPNIGWARVPAQGANTHPEVVAALVELCFEAGAKAVKIADHTLGIASRCYRLSGILKAPIDAGAEVEIPDPAKFKMTRFGGEFIKEWEVYTDILDADKRINVPVAKHHDLTRLTMAMKNWFGMLGGERQKLHEQIETSITDMAQFFEPDLTVLDATRILYRNGPQGGSLADVRKADIVAASTDQVAVDALGASLLEIAPSQVPTIEAGHQRGLGKMNLEELRVVEKSL